MPKTLTIFTPTYNRADLLPRGFEALCRQSSRDFVWLIVDDGSTDGTREVVESFQTAPCGFEIRYIYKENGGLHTGYNTAIAHADTELCMCIDSDDWVADDAVANLLALWQQVKRPDCAGIVALDASPDGTPTCHIEGEGTYVNLNAYDASHPWAGDRKLIVRTDLYKSVAPMPTYPGEKNFNPQYMHIKIAANHPFYVWNQVVCIVDYQETGMSAGIFRQFVNSPNSFAAYRRLQMTTTPNRWKYIVKNAIHYDSSCILAGRPGDIVSASPRRLLTACLTPLGLALSIYIRYKAR